MTTHNNHDATTSRTHLAIFALVAPGILFVCSFILLAVINLIFNPTFWMTGDTEPVNPTPFGITMLNRILLVSGAAGLISLLPGLLIGVFLLMRSKYSKNE